MTKYSFVSSQSTWLGIIRTGSDLGSSFDHRDGYVYFLFGDTPSNENRDPIGRTNVSSPGPDGISLEMLPGFLTIPDIGQKEFEVPTGGFSSGGRLHVFFTTNHYKDDTGDHMGRCVLASAEHPTDTFQDDLEVSRLPSIVRDGVPGVGKFINVCPAIPTKWFPPTTALSPGYDFWIDGVLMWGSGDYRKSDVYLAWAPLDRVRDPEKYDWLYYKQPPPVWWATDVWWRSEESATPLLGLSECTVGELSVTFIPGLNLWIMMYGGVFDTAAPPSSPRVVKKISAKFALAPNPWGPWTRYADPVRGIELELDLTKDNAFGQANTGPYGFYIIDRFTRWDELNHQATLCFTVSENDQEGTGIYRTHLVKSVLSFDLVIEVPSATVTVSPETITCGEDATVTITFDHPFPAPINLQASIYDSGVANVSFSPDREIPLTSIPLICLPDAVDVRFNVYTKLITSTIKSYTAEIAVDYVAPPGKGAGAVLRVETAVKGGILSDLIIFANIVMAGRSIQGQVALEEAVTTDTPVSVFALDPGGGVITGPSDAVSFDPPDGVVIISAGSTMKQFTIHANTVSNTREVTIVASAVVEKRTHLTVERRG